MPWENHESPALIIDAWSISRIFHPIHINPLCLSPSIASIIPSFMVSSLIGSCGVLVSKFPNLFPSFHIFGAYVKDLAVLASWIYMDGLISGWFVGTPILGHLHIHIYIHTYIEWLKSRPMGIQITIYRQWYYVLICIGHTAKSNHMCYHPYIALKGRHLLSFSGLNRCLRSIPRM